MVVPFGSERLGKYIRWIFVSWHVDQLDTTLLHFVANVVDWYVDVLRFREVYWVLRHLKRWLVIGVDYKCVE